MTAAAIPIRQLPIMKPPNRAPEPFLQLFRDARLRARPSGFRVRAKARAPE
jgi:hypothetical protein